MREGVSWHAVTRATGRTPIENAVKESRGRRLKELREALGYTQSELAEACGFAQGVVAQLESGRRGLTGSIALDKMATGFGVDLGQLHAYLDGGIPLDDIRKQAKPGVPRMKPAWQREGLRWNEARPTLHQLYIKGVDADFIRGFVHRVNRSGKHRNRNEWFRYALERLQRWETRRPELRDQTLQDWLRQKRPPLATEIAEAMRTLYPPGVPMIEDWDDLHRNLVTARTEWAKQHKKTSAAPTVAELLELLEKAG
jgi:transcriptional regulator with XRE-family HTH domain